MIEIREFLPRDISAALKLWENTPNMGMHPIDDTPAEIEKFLGKNQGLSFIALENGELIGAVLCGDDGRRATIYHAAVAQHKQRQGIAKKLLQACENAARGQGVSRMRLMIWANNAEGKKFWTALGWQECPEINYFNRDLV